MTCIFNFGRETSTIVSQVELKSLLDCQRSKKPASQQPALLHWCSTVMWSSIFLGDAIPCCGAACDSFQIFTRILSTFVSSAQSLLRRTENLPILWTKGQNDFYNSKPRSYELLAQNSQKDGRRTRWRHHSHITVAGNTLMFRKSNEKYEWMTVNWSEIVSHLLSIFTGLRATF